MLAEFLRQRGTFRVRKGTCRKWLKHWAAVFPSFVANPISASNSDAERGGLQGEIVDMTFKYSRQRCLEP